ncbi:MAG: M48 family metallopeptidase [Candidatus Rifleibacteriota bacterium]
MEPEKIEKVFWIIFLLWVVLRMVLMGAQLVGNTDQDYLQRVRQYFSEEQIQAGKQYALDGFWVKFAYGFLYAGIMIYLMKTGVFARVYDLIVEKVGAGLLRADLLFTISLLLFIQFLYLPYAYYMGFLKEVRMGFSNMTSMAWLIRFVKSAAVSITLESMGIIFILWIIGFFQKSWVWVLPVGMGLFSIFVTLIYPIVITPIFYEQKPLGQGEFRKMLMDIGEKAGLQIDEIYVINESRYSSHTNAYFTGFGSHKRIVLYDNLIKSHTPEEAALIFAHEAGHWRHNHVAIGLFLGFIALFLLSVILKQVFPYLLPVRMFGLRELTSAANLPFFIIVAMIFQLFTAPIESQISQYMERQADQAALDLTGLKDVYVSAEKRLALDNKSDLTPSPLRVFWLYSHPPALERIEMAEKK